VQPSFPPSRTNSRARSRSCGAATASIRRAGTVVLVALAGACGDSAGPIDLASARIDFVDGAVEAIVSPGRIIVVEGFGFGTEPGTASFRDAAGAPIAASVDPNAWTNFSARVTVPPGAVAGPLTLVTASGRRLTAVVHLVPAPAFNTASLAWQSRPDFPRAPLGVALAVAEFPTGTGWNVTLYAAGGAEPVSGDSVFDADSLVYVAKVQPGGAISAWTAQSRPLTARRAFAAAAVATRYNSRTSGAALYVIGGIDVAGRPQASVIAADLDSSGVVSQFVTVEPLPAPVAGAMAVVRRGRLYVMGGTDSAGRPQRSVYVGRVGLDGRIDGWYVQPELPSPRAYGGGVVLNGRALAFGGIADSTGPGGELDALPARLATTDTARLSPVSGFFTGSWGPGTPLLPAGRSQFATLDLADVVLVVGGLYPGGTAEVLAATVTGDSLGPFAGPAGTNSIAGQGGGTLVGPAGASWRDADGTRHGVVVGGFDLVTRLRRNGVWGF
jgi:hypothetical protein